MKDRDRIFSMEVSGWIRIIFTGKNTTFVTPYIITNYNNKENKLTKIKNLEDIQNLKLQELFDMYNIIPGSFEESLNWSCDFLFEENGIYTFQII